MDSNHEHEIKPLMDGAYDGNIATKSTSSNLWHDKVLRLLLFINVVALLLVAACLYIFAGTITHVGETQLTTCFEGA
jgi:hypothetical protein